MNEKFARTKNKIKEHLPIIASTAVAVIAVAYAVHTKINILESESCSTPDDMRMAIDDEGIEKLKKGKTLTWYYDDYNVDLTHVDHLY